MNAFNKIIGYESIKKELIQISDILANIEPYKALGVAVPRGLLLHGEPGVGKTLMASVIIKESGRRAYTCRKDKPNGDFIKSIRKTFTDAVAAAPSIVFLDDMDKFANGDERHPDAEEYVTVQSCIDNIKGKDVFVLATANNIDNLPGSLLRAGRFDRVIEIEAPTGEDALNIVSHYMKSKKFVSKVDPETVAKMMDGRSCAELETIINEAGLYAGFERSEEITMDHFMKACLHNIHNIPIDVLNQVYSPEKSSVRNVISREIAYHEAGHTVIAELLNPGSVTFISAYSSQDKHGGFTSVSCDNRVGTEKIYNDIYVSLGGMAAVDMKFGKPDSGNPADLKHAFRCANNLIEYNCVLGFDLHRNSYDDSDKLKERQENAAAIEVEHCYRKVKQMLVANSEFLDKVADRICRRGIVSSAELSEIKQDCKILPIAV